MKLPLCDERGGGRKEKRHVPHHLFDQRLYSTIHSYLATLANYNLPTISKVNISTCMTVLLVSDSRPSALEFQDDKKEEVRLFQL